LYGASDWPSPPAGALSSTYHTQSITWTMTCAWTVCGLVGWLSVSVYLNESWPRRGEHGFGDM
jgi:hypothetical protein